MTPEHEAEYEQLLRNLAAIESGERPHGEPDGVKQMIGLVGAWLTPETRERIEQSVAGEKASKRGSR